MLARKNQDNPGENISKEWLDQVQELLNTTYKDKCVAEGRVFSVYGKTFVDEIMMIVSFLNPNKQNEIPMTVSLSLDYQQQKRDDKILADILDCFGLVFDTLFENNDEEDIYNPIWQELDFKNRNFFYKVTRENILLTMEADRLLAEADKE